MGQNMSVVSTVAAVLRHAELDKILPVGDDLSRSIFLRLYPRTSSSHVVRLCRLWP